MFIILLVTLCACGSAKRITVQGTAMNYKDGAGVITDEQFYMIKGLDAWDSTYYEKQVKITGKLKTINPDTTISQYPIPLARQMRYGSYFLITKPKWQLVQE